MYTLLQDVRYALRMMRKSPAFSLAAILTLALGMGANTVMFSVLNTVLLRPLPYPHPDRLVQIWETDSRRGEVRGPVSAYNFVDWRSQSQTLAQMATYDSNSAVLTGLKTPRRVYISFVSAGFFDVLQIAPLKGRTFLAGEDDPGKDRVVVLSYGAWLRHFGSDPGIVGRSITLDGNAYSVVGVMPGSFAFPGPGTEMWCLPGFDLKKVGHRHHGLFAVGRMKPGILLYQAQAEMNTIADGLDKQYGTFGGVRLVGLQDETVGNARRSLLVLWAAVIAVLLIACANVAGLLLARAVSRQKEVAIRVALGGTRTRLIRQFLTESVLLALAGGGLGVLLALGAGRFVIASSNGAIPRLRDLQINAWVLAFSGAVCIVTGVMFGLAPALHALRSALNTSLKEGGSRSSQLSDRLHLRSFFVVSELALAVVLLVSAGLLTKTLWRLQHVDTGFQSENILSFRFALPQAKYPEPRQRADLYQRIEERLAALPGVESVGATSGLPFGGSRSATSFDIEGRPYDAAHMPLPHADYRTVSPAYFQTMRMPLLEGREFTLHDSQSAPSVTVVSQAFVRKFFPDRGPIGQRLKIHDQFFEIVGVVADIKQDDMAAPGIPEMYASHLQADASPTAFFVVRSRTELRALAASVRSAVQEITPDEPIYSLSSMNDRLSLAIAPQKFSSLLLGIFAGLALLLAAIGIYGVISYMVAQRTHEIGIRMALGADRRDVLRLILRQGARIAAIGLTLGTVAAQVATQALSSLLFGVNAKDPGIFLGVGVLLALVVLLASYVPARRATKVDPLVALRCE
jgi:putative ABC transport system permease protein